MDILEGLARGQIPDAFPFQYDTEFDASSPWSLILSFYPETRLLDRQKFETSSEVSLETYVKDFVTSECRRLKWTKEDAGDCDILTYFVKVRLMQADTVSGQLQIPPVVHEEAQLWIDGVVRVLQLWRRLNNESREPKLADFEEWDAEIVFQQLLEFRPAGWDLRQRLEFLILPYLRYKSRMDLINSWLLDQAPLEDAQLMVFVPELSAALLKVCLRAKLADWRLVKQIIDNIKPKEDDEHSTLESTNVTLEDLHKPSAFALNFISDLTNIAKAGIIEAPSFSKLAEWSIGSKDIQEDVLIRYLQSNHHFTVHDLNLLRRTVLSRLDDSTIARKTIRAALQNARFRYIQSNELNTHLDIVKDEVMELVAEFDASPVPERLPLVIAALELLPEKHGLLSKYRRLSSMHTAFGIDPAFALSHEPLEIVARALEIDTNAYLRYSELVKIIAGEENSAKVAEQCVEAALADDNFDAVVEFIERKSIEIASPSAWLAYYQAGKYLSPSWTIPRNPAILKQQLKFLSNALSVCPSDDILSVLRTWSATEAELREAALMAVEEAEAVSSSSSPPPRESDTMHNSERVSRTPGEGARDHISNLLVSGIGWAIGANPH